MQRERRRDPYPWTWEIPAAVTIASLLVLVLGLQLGRSLANLLVGAGWTWPTHPASPDSPGVTSSPLGSEFWSSIPGVLTGHAGAGLPGLGQAAAGPRLLWTSVVLTELTLWALVAWCTIRCLRRWGPGRLRGMATRAEAEKILGVTRLRKVAPMVRPDLYGGRATGAGDARVQHHTSTGDPPDPADAADTPVGRGMSPWLLVGRDKT